MKKFVQFITAIIFVCAIFPVNAAINNKEITIDKLNVRSGPGLSYSVIGTINKNKEVTILSSSNGWYEISYKDTTGWIASWKTKTIDNKKSVQKEDVSVITTVNHLNMRTEPSTNSSVLLQMPAGSRATLVEELGEWSKIKFEGQTGFVASQFLTKEQINLEKNKETPKKQLFEIVVNKLNVRAKDSLDAKKVAEVKKGQRFKILDRTKTWVHIQLPDNKDGWVFAFYGQETNLSPNDATEKNSDGKMITIVYNGTNLRKSPSTDSEVVYRANAGESFSVESEEDEWLQITTSDGQTAFVANWVVSINNSNEKQKKKEERKKGTLKGLTIVVDPGHGGNDQGTSGVRGTEEKSITLQTAELLAGKLTQAGANVILTRDSDVYVDLRKRVSIGHQVAADAFVSIHYDATDISSINGFTTYYMFDFQKDLANAIHEQLGTKISLRNRGVQKGNYLVLRENRQVAVLLELGFLSNASEERTITTENFREQATIGIYKGILNYFDDQLQ